jgi:tetratricopeptide (TPR) repeat protein
MRLLWISCLCAAALSSTSRAQQSAGSGWTGKRVVTLHGAVLDDPRTGRLDDAGRARDLALSGHGRSEFRTYRVEKVDDARLWLRDEKGPAEGWVDVSWVVPFDRAIAFYTAKIKDNPGHAASHVDRALIWQEKGEIAAAIADLDEAIRLDPKHAMAYHNRGVARRTRREYDKAIVDYGEAIRLDPRLAWAYNDRGLAWTAKNEHDKAVADHSEAIRLDPKLASAYSNRANTWAAKKDYAKAIADHSEAIRRDPKLAGAYNNRAWLRATCPEAKYRDGRAAVDDATKAFEMDGRKGAHHLGTLAAAYAERGDFPKAVETQAKAQRLYKDEGDLKRGRERTALYKAGKPYREPTGAD